jgi:hypothetical protein
MASLADVIAASTAQTDVVVGKMAEIDGAVQSMQSQVLGYAANGIEQRVYVDGVSGLDGNDGLTTATPKKTFGGASAAVDLLKGAGWVRVQFKVGQTFLVDTTMDSHQGVLLSIEPWGDVSLGKPILRQVMDANRGHPGQFRVAGIPGALVFSSVQLESMSHDWGAHYLREFLGMICGPYGGGDVLLQNVDAVGGAILGGTGRVAAAPFIKVASNGCSFSWDSSAALVEDSKLVNNGSEEGLFFFEIYACTFIDTSTSSAFSATDLGKHVFRNLHFDTSDEPKNVLCPGIAVSKVALGL